MTAMISRIFVRLLSMSITASLIILAVMVFRFLLRKVPKIFSYILWGPVLLRLLCPVTYSAPVSLIPSRLDSNGIAAQITGCVVIDVSAGPEASELAGSTLTGWEIAGWIWAAGVFLIMLVQLHSWLRLRGTVACSLRLRDELYIADGISTAFVLGVFRPRIFLPSQLGTEEREYIIDHEGHHIRRYDPLWRLLAAAALCLHWFNPLVWLGFYLSAIDMEMSCDEAVLRKRGQGIGGDYATSLLKLATVGPVHSWMPLAFCNVDPSARIRNILRWKKPSLAVISACVLLCGLLLASFSADPVIREILPESESRQILQMEIPEGWNYSVGVRSRHTQQVSMVLYPEEDDRAWLEVSLYPKGFSITGECMTEETVTLDNGSQAVTYQYDRNEPWNWMLLRNGLRTVFVNKDHIFWTQDAYSAEISEIINSIQLPPVYSVGTSSVNLAQQDRVVLSPETLGSYLLQTESGQITVDLSHASRNTAVYLYEAYTNELLAAYTPETLGILTCAFTGLSADKLYYLTVSGDGSDIVTISQ